MYPRSQHVCAPMKAFASQCFTPRQHHPVKSLCGGRNPPFLIKTGRPHTRANTGKRGKGLISFAAASARRPGLLHSLLPYNGITSSIVTQLQALTTLLSAAASQALDACRRLMSPTRCMYLACTPQMFVPPCHNMVTELSNCVCTVTAQAHAGCCKVMDMHVSS